MTVTSTNHGLSVLTDADPDHRLLRPVAEIVSNCFNDATSGHLYDHSSGHEGIDFSCAVGTKVKAMYRGEVIKVKTNDTPPYGLYVQIRSYTDRAHHAGFEHRYAHLSEIKVKLNQSVDKGELIGHSGNTGGVQPHLHVHLKPFDANGKVPSPGEDNPPGCSDYKKPDRTPKTFVADRISGCMNFACFLPPDNGVPAIAVAGPLLSPRDSYASIPVYQKPKLDAILSTIDGSNIGCYAVKDTQQVGDITWYQIRFSDTQNGWVAREGIVIDRDEQDPVKKLSNVEWVHVEDSTLSALPVRTTEPAAITHDDITRVHSDASTSSTVLGQLRPHIRYSILGTNLSRDEGSSSVDGSYNDVNRWWKINLPEDSDWPTRRGWVRSDVVRECGDVRLINRLLPPALPRIVPWIGGGAVFLRPGPDSSLADIGTLDPARLHTVLEFIDGPPAYQWYKIEAVGTETAQVRRVRARATSSPTAGWVQAHTVRLSGSLAAVPRPPYLRVTAAGTVPLRTGPGLGYVDAIHQLSPRPGIWHKIVGRNRDWWKIQVDVRTAGWLPTDQTTTAGATGAVPLVHEGSLPRPPTAAGANAPSSAAQAHGFYLNLANSWEGTWTVSKSGRTVTAAFQSTRSPVQYLARQRPTDLLALPTGFRPTTPQDLAVTGTHVHETGTPFASGATAPFTLRVEPTGAVRYVNGPELDHVGYLRYATGRRTWQASEALATPARPDPEDLAAAGTYLNQQVNHGSRWTLARRGERVTGSFASTRSPVAYYANQNREPLLRLPEAYRPARSARFQVQAAHRVQADGTASPDTRRVDFHLTMEPNGEMRYDRDLTLQAAGVGYLRYTVAVAWTAEPRVQVPAAPENLHVEEVAARSVELDWSQPGTDGGARIRAYRIETWEGQEWDVAVSDTGSTHTRHELRRLRPYRHYSWRVRARNAAGWGDPSAAVSVTTRREAPGQTTGLTATATRDQVTLAWQAAAGRVTGYQVQRHLSGGRWRLVAPDTGSAVTHFADRSVVPGGAYVYRVRATHYGEAGDWSSSVTIATAAAPVTSCSSIGRPRAIPVAASPATALSAPWTAPRVPG